MQSAVTRLDANTLQFDAGQRAPDDCRLFLPTLAPAWRKMVILCTYSEALAAYTGPRHLWRRSDISLKLEGRAYRSVVYSVLLCGRGIWSLRAENVHRFGDGNHQYPSNMSSIGLSGLVRRVQVKDVALNAGSGNTSQRMKPSGLRRLGILFRMAKTWLPHNAVFCIFPAE